MKKRHGFVELLKAPYRAGPLASAAYGNYTLWQDSLPWVLCFLKYARLYRTRRDGPIFDINREMHRLLMKWCSPSGTNLRSLDGELCHICCFQRSQFDTIMLFHKPHSLESRLCRYGVDVRLRYVGARTAAWCTVHAYAVRSRGAPITILAPRHVALGKGKLSRECLASPCESRNA